MKRSMILLFLFVRAGWADTNALNIPDPILSEIGFAQHIGQQIPVDLVFNEESGQPVKMRDLFGTRAVLLGMVYFRCPHLCQLEIQGIIRATEGPAFRVGSEYEVILVSMDPKDTPKAAAVKKRSMLIGYTKPLQEKGFHFLTGNENSIRELTSSIGYRYVYDKKSDEFAHPAGIVIVSPEGRISRYLFGIDYPPRDLRLALVEASHGKLGTITDRFLLFCYHYDPVGGKYGLQIMRSLRVFGVGIVLALLALVLGLRWQERRGKQNLASEVPQ